jgi:hypothetical protein
VSGFHSGAIVFGLGERKPQKAQPQGLRVSLLGPERIVSNLEIIKSRCRLANHARIHGAMPLTRGQWITLPSVLWSVISTTFPLASFWNSSSDSSVRTKNLVAEAANQKENPHPGRNERG